MKIDSIQPSKKAKLFCARTFRKELKGSEALKSLKDFIFLLQNDDSIILNFMENGGSVFEILSLIDTTANRDLTTALPVFDALQIIFMRFQGSNSEYHSHCFEGAKHILKNHLETLQSLLLMNISKHKRVALKLLTAIVTLDSSLAFQVLNLFSFSSSEINDLIVPVPEKESARKYFILFALSFLLEGNPTLIKAVMDNKGFLSMIIPGLKYDEATTVSMTLSLMESKILKNLKISKTLKLKTFNTQIVASLFDLFDWKGPLVLKKFLPKQKKKYKVFEVDQKDKELVMDSLYSFLLVLCTSKKFGISFSDKSAKCLLSLNNQLLLSVFEGLQNPLSNSRMADIILKTLITCPDLVKSTLLKLEPFLQPRNSNNWFEAVQFAENLLRDLDVVSYLKDEKIMLEGSALKIVKTFCTPASLLRTAKAGTEIEQPLEVRLRALGLLKAMWDSALKVTTYFIKSELDVKISVNEIIFEFLPNFKGLTGLWQDLCNKDFLESFLPETRLNYLMVTLEAFMICVECSKVKEISPFFLASYLLDYLKKTEKVLQKEEYVTVQAYVLKFIEMDIHLLTPEMDLCKTALQIAFQSEKLLGSACIILSNLEIFENNLSEIDIWLLCFINLSPEDRIFVSNCLIESIKSTTLFMNNEEYTKKKMSSFVFLCINQLEMIKSSNDENSEKLISFKRYLGDVVIRLQHFYPETTVLYEKLEGLKKIVGKPIVEYLKCWTTHSLSPSNALKTNLCQLEQEVEMWLLNENDVRGVEEILNCELEIYMQFRLFTMLIGHLVMKTIKNDLNGNVSEKFSSALSYFINSDKFQVTDETPRFISCNLKNIEVFHKKCLEHIFQNEILLKAFNLFTKKKSGTFYSTKIIVETIMKNKSFVKIDTIKALIQNWKVKFLYGLKKKLRKKKSVQSNNYFEVVLNFFDYHDNEIKDVVEVLTNVSDLNLFVENGEPSKWIFTLIKFIKLHCQNEVNESLVTKLCLITKYLHDVNCSNSSELHDCFVLIIKNHPKSLLFITNDILDIILHTVNVSHSTITLGKLLLNDPVKIKHFLSLTLNHVKLELVFPLLSSLVFNSDSFYEAIASESACLNWKISEISKNSAPLLFQCLKNIFFQFHEKIIHTLKGNDEPIILQNLPLVRCLIRLFIARSTLKLIKKDIRRGNFQPVLLFEAIKKFSEDSLTEIYLQGLIARFSRLLKDLEYPDEQFWTSMEILMPDVRQLIKNLKSENIVNSPDWKDFFKSSLRICFKTSKYASILRVLRLLIDILYQPIDDFKSEMALNFQMIISHSQFLNIILGKSALKSEVIELFYSLVEKNPSEMSSKHVPILLASYGATLSSADKTILKMLQIYERNGFSFREFEPLVWGEVAISHYSVGSVTGLSLWKKFNMINVLNLLDPQKLDFSLKEFPIYRKLEFSNQTQNIDDGNCDTYDPAFLLPLFSNLLSPGYDVFILPFIYKGALAYTIRALSSECIDTRKIASVVLSRFYSHLELSQNMKQKPVWLHFINCFRFGTEDISVEPIPNIITLFFARMTLEISGNLSEIHLPLQNFLLAKTYFSFKAIPEFLPLFYSSHVFSGKHRIWLLKILKDAIKTSADVQVVFYSMALKVVFCFFHSQFCDMELKKIIIQIIERLINVKKSELLFSEYALLSWINSIDFNSCAEILIDLLTLLDNCNNVIAKNVKFIKSQPTVFSYTIQILNIAIRLLPIVNAIKSLDTFNVYLKIFYKCLLVLHYLKNNEWIKINSSGLQSIIDSGVIHLGIDVGKFKTVNFYIKDSENNNCDDVFHHLKRIVFLFQLLLSYDENKK